tara:strand:+ start:2123 stop:2311 length:189 start_codon:yes stop_codon:yes gene_type:complete
MLPPTILLHDLDRQFLEQTLQTPHPTGKAILHMRQTVSMIESMERLRSPISIRNNCQLIGDR